MNEKSALKALKRKDEAALAWFIDHYAAYVNTIIYNIIGTTMSPSDIEEVTSDVFFTFWTNAEKILPGKVKAYLSGIARNKAKEKTRKIGQDVPLENDIIIFSTNDPQHIFEVHEQAAFINQAILDMQYPDKEIFLRHYYCYQPLSTIADEMDMNISTVKTKLRRGRNKLKDILAEGGYIIEGENF